MITSSRSFRASSSPYGPLFRNLVRREIRQRHKGSVLGIGWNLVIPAVMIATYTFVFRYVFRSSVEDYVIYLACGLAAWTLFVTAVQTAASSLVANANLLKKVRFPREIIPLASMAASALVGVVMVAIALVLCLVFRPVGPMLVMLPVFLVLLAAFTVGLGLMLSAVNVYLRDVEFLFGALTMPWFFLTPILFSFADLPETLREDSWVLWVLHWVNPVTPFIFGIQDAMFYARWPSVGDTVYSVVAAAAMLTVGSLVFRRLERDIAVEL